MPAAESCEDLLKVAFFLGLAGSAFPFGVGYVSRWTSPERQGSALGVYGLDNIRQSAAAAAQESFLAGHHEGALPAAVASGLLFFACFGLYRFIQGVDREIRRKP